MLAFLKWVTGEYPVLHERNKFFKTEVAQSCPTVCDPMDCSPPGSFVHGIFQARVLEWVAVAFSRIGKLKVEP